MNLNEYEFEYKRASDETYYKKRSEKKKKFQRIKGEKRCAMKNESKAYYEFKVDVKGALPVYEQVKRAIKLAILSGQLVEGERLMTVKELAQKLQINPNTIIKTYYQMELEGFLYSRPGYGYYVQLDREKLKGAKHKIFTQETLDYINKVISLGYTYDDIMAEMKISFNRGTSPEEVPVTGTGTLIKEETHAKR